MSASGWRQPPHDLAKRIEQILLDQRQGKREGREIRFTCPAHDDEHPSARFNRTKGVWVCDACKAGGSQSDLAQRLRLMERPNAKTPRREIVATYDYKNTNGTLLFQVVRYVPKVFKQRRPDGKGGWIYKLDGTKRVLYRLPQLLAADPALPVYVTEGEKDADRLARLGLVATTNPNGAGKWKPEYAECLRGRHVVILPDNDDAGRAHRDTIARSLQRIAASVRVLELAGLPEKGDVSDFLDRGGTLEQLVRLVSELPTAESDEPKKTTAGEPPRSAASRLVDLASGSMKFHSPEGIAFADITVDGHRETWPVKSSGLRNWLKQQFWKTYRAAPPAQAVVDAIGVIEALALFEGPTIPVSLRVASHESAVYLDLIDQAWRAVRIDAEGWRIVPDPPVRFRRPHGALALPEPAEGGSLGLLREVMNVGGDGWTLMASWLIGASNPQGPYAVLVLIGPQGSTKSSRSRMLRGLIDPNTAPLRSLPRDERDLVIAANNGHALCFDNVSHLPQWLSDALCRIATGAGFGTRELYTDTNEILFSSQRPVLLNGIEEFVTRGDLLDRSLVVELEPLPNSSRREEREVFGEYEKARPLILGALLDGVSAALRNRDALRFSNLPRLADFATWVTAAEPGVGVEPGTFVEALAANRSEASDLAVEASTVGSAVRSFMLHKTNWTGTAGQLLIQLAREAGDERQRSKDWPKSPKGLSDALRRVLPNLTALGVQVAFLKRTKSGRLIEIYGQKATERPSSSSSPSPEQLHHAFEGDGRVDRATAGDDSGPPTSSENANDVAAVDADDGGDELFQDSSGDDQEELLG